MMRVLLRVIIPTMLVLVLGQSSALAEDGPRARPEHPRGERKDDGERKPRQHRHGDRVGPQGRKLLKSLDPAEREELHRLFRQLKRQPPGRRRRILRHLGTLPPEKRLEAISAARARILREDAQWKKLEGRLHTLQRESRKHLKLPPELQRGLQGVDDRTERRRIMRKFFDEHREKNGTKKRQVLIDGLPNTLRERVKKLPRREQTRFLRWRRGHELLARVFETEGGRRRFINANPAAFEELLDLETRTPQQRRRPESFARTAWKRWLDLKRYERLRIVHTVIRMRSGKDQRPQHGKLKRPDPRNSGGPPHQHERDQK